MNQSTIRVLALCSLIATFGAVGAQAQAPVHFTIPFDFTVGRKAFAAGNYNVGELAPRVLLIRSENGHAALTVLANGDQPGKIPGKATLSFHRYGDQYFLFKVSNSNQGWGLPQSVREKELIAASASPANLDVIASSRK